MKVATLEKFHLGGWGNQDPGDPGVVKVRGERIFFLQAGEGGTDPEWHCMIFKANYFAVDKGKSLTGSTFIKADMILSCVYVESQLIYFQMIFYTVL